MGIAELLFNLLLVGSGLAASGAAGEFGKGAGRAAFEALKTLLVTRHGADSLKQLDAAGDTPDVAAAIRSDLDQPGIARDAEVRRLAADLRAAIEALPDTVTAPHAIEIRRIRTGGHLLVENVAGIRSDSAVAGGDMTFRDVRAPPGKP
jgi:hypothetical protein